MAEENEGTFLVSLKRNNKQIRDDRASAIAKAARLMFKREIEDMDFSIDEMQTERDNMLDMSPTNAQSLIVASDFNAKDYIGKEKELTRKIRDEIIMRNLMQARFVKLFGGKRNMLREETEVEPVNTDK